MSRPNVLLILSDDTPADWIGCYGGAFPTPNLDSIARRGVRYSQAFCASALCPSSRFNVLTGCFGGRCEDPVFRAAQPADRLYSMAFDICLESSRASLGKLFQAAGYRTGFAGKWQVGHERDRLDLPAINPDEDIAEPATAEKLLLWQKRQQQAVREAGGFDWAGGVVWGNNDEFQPLPCLRQHHLEWSLDAAQRFLAVSAATQEPFFLHFATTTCHGPDILDTLAADARNTPEGRFGRIATNWTPRGDWAGMIERLGWPVNHETVSMAWLDHDVGRLLDQLDAQDQLDNTIVLFAGDHGNEPGKGTCYDIGSRIPLLIAGPGLSAGEIHDRLFENVDVLGLLGRICDLKLPHGAVCDSRPDRVDLYFENGYTRAIRTDRWKYIAFRYPPDILADLQAGRLDCAPGHLGFGTGRARCQQRIAMEHYPAYFEPDQLYDLHADPAEQDNRAADPRCAGILADLKTRLREQLADFDYPYPLDDADQIAYLRSDAFAALAAAARAVGTGDIAWWTGRQVRLDRRPG